MIPKFSKLDKLPKENKSESSIVYDGYIKVVQYKDYEFTKESDMVIILPYLRDEGYVLLRHEPIPTYQYYYRNLDDYKNITHFLTCISGTIEKGEKIENTVRRELYEEAGIVLSSMYQINFDKHLFVSKGNSTKYHICLLELRYNDFKLTKAPGDGTESEKQSKTVKISLGDLDNLRTHDLITDYLITKFKLQYNLK